MPPKARRLRSATCVVPVALEVEVEEPVIEVENTAESRMSSVESTEVSDLSRIISRTAQKTKRRFHFTVAKGNIEEEEEAKKEDDTKATSLEYFGETNLGLRISDLVKAANVKPVPQAKIEPKGTIINSIKDGYEIERVLGRGGFGVVYKVKSRKTGMIYALKTEEKTTALVCQRLKCEAWIMFSMSNRKSPYFLDLIDCGQTSRSHFVVMPLIGRSLDVIKKSLLNDDDFSPSTVVKLMLTTFHAIEDMHDCGFLHRDIKPANFAVGLEDWSKIYILDFGISRHYRDHDASILRPRRFVPFIGTLRYAPRSCHASQEYGRCGDLESWLFMSLELWQSNFLPWSNEQDRDKYYLHKKDLLASPERYFMSNPAMPMEFCHIGMYIGSLNNVQKPDYPTIRTLLENIPNSYKNIDLNKNYDWLDPNIMHRAQQREVDAREKRKMEGLSEVSNATAYFVYGV